MADKEYICLSSEGATFAENELHQCPKCGEYSCPTCGGEVQTIEEYELAMKLNSER